MPVIFKYPVPITDDGTFEHLLPRGAKVLSVGIQQRGGDGGERWEEIVMWVEIAAFPSTASMEHTETRRFLCINTGNVYANSKRFIGTITADTGVVWHLFEL
jgi:hypothetical protein